ncbi:MAG: hypothetical protein GY829_15780 [Gammaproteobacteria bacterium]|nr:hypothetical protein [Gammaproteobacteria bacterium]
MSLINNIPFDINRTPVEQNATVKHSGTVPVQHSKELNPTEKHNKIIERRKSNRRNKQSKKMKVSKRLLGERREDANSKKANELSEKSNKPGIIIDLEV